MKKLIFSIFLFYGGFISGFADEFRGKIDECSDELVANFSAIELYQKAENLKNLAILNRL